ncbi:hypothetical protein [Halopseudomonas maritima]|uniref:hypothetical protein n=1 Tax=Halopseudomonas maritima TaxID=2918528 RepID=UPI001EEB0DD8|nr:hypothetical protein [Halopseudomonas maritima]UJJ30323.1 hypothetical protein HV822_11020 [Halopseudomonas maritima]
MAHLIPARRAQSLGAVDYDCLSITGNEQAGRIGKQHLLSRNEHSHFRGHHHHLLTWR